MRDRDVPTSAGQRAAQASDGDGGDGRPETSLQRLDRNLEDLTGELRVVVTVGTITAAAVAVPFAALWFLAPLLRRAERQPGGSADDEAGTAALHAPDAPWVGK